MPHTESTESNAAYQGLATGLSSLVTWKWDGRFSTALAEFPVSQKEALRAVLEQHLPRVWDMKGIGEAGEAVQAVKRRLGGLMPGQLLFAPEDPSTSSLFCAWWPWGNGTTISIRIGSTDEATVDLKSLFSIE